MEKIPTAEEFLETKKLSPSKDMYDGYNITYSYLQSLLIEFAKLHVEAALQNIVEHGCVEYIDLTNDEVVEDYSSIIADDDISAQIEEESILNAYPLDNIK